MEYRWPSRGVAEVTRGVSSWAEVMERGARSRPLGRRRMTPLSTPLSLKVVEGMVVVVLTGRPAEAARGEGSCCGMEKSKK